MIVTTEIKKILEVYLTNNKSQINIHEQHKIYNYKSETIL